MVHDHALSIHKIARPSKRNWKGFILEESYYDYKIRLKGHDVMFVSGELWDQVKSDHATLKILSLEIKDTNYWRKHITQTKNEKENRD